MDQTAFDVFFSVKNFLYLGDYGKCLEEISIMDINEDDLSQRLKKSFYTFISYLESKKDEEINNLLKELKSQSQTEAQLKTYFNLFLFVVFYVYKEQFDENKFSNFINDLKGIKRFDPKIFPAIYIIGLLAIDRKQYKDFLAVIDKFTGDIEILGLKFHLMFMLNKEQEMEKIINSMNLKDSDSMISQICTLIYGLYIKNDWETAIENLQNISKNNKISSKLFNLIGVSLMSKGVFDEAAKIFNLGKEMCEKNGDINSDYSCLLVNLITCYRNLGKSDEMKNIEESLKKNDPANNYFARCAEFEEEFTKALTN
jgi:tetratricopeptide (TPR) repeat protein